MRAVEPQASPSERATRGRYARKCTPKTPLQTKNATLWSMSTWSEWWPSSSSQTPVAKIIAVLATRIGASTRSSISGGPFAR